MYVRLRYGPLIFEDIKYCCSICGEFEKIKLISNSFNYSLFTVVMVWVLVLLFPVLVLSSCAVDCFSFPPSVCFHTLFSSHLRSNSFSAPLSLCIWILFFPSLFISTSIPHVISNLYFVLHLFRLLILLCRLPLLLHFQIFLLGFSALC